MIIIIVVMMIIIVKKMVPILSVQKIVNVYPFKNSAITIRKKRNKFPLNRGCIIIYVNEFSKQIIIFIVDQVWTVCNIERVET